MSTVIISFPKHKQSSGLWMHSDCCARIFGEAIRDEALRTGAAESSAHWHHRLVGYTLEKWGIVARICPICTVSLQE